MIPWMILSGDAAGVAPGHFQCHLCFAEAIGPRECQQIFPKGLSRHSLLSQLLHPLRKSSVNPRATSSQGASRVS